MQMYGKISPINLVWVSFGVSMCIGLEYLLYWMLKRTSLFKKMGCVCCVIQLTYIQLSEAVPYEVAKSRIVFSFNSSFLRLMTQGIKTSHSYYLICILNGDDRGWNWELPDVCTCLTFMLSLPPQSKHFLGCIGVQKLIATSAVQYCQKENLAKEGKQAVNVIPLDTGMAVIPYFSLVSRNCWQAASENLLNRCILIWSADMPFKYMKLKSPALCITLKSIL